MLVPSIVTDKHGARIADGGRPFAIGQIDPSKGFVHVLDDATLDILPRTDIRT